MALSMSMDEATELVHIAIKLYGQCVCPPHIEGQDCTFEGCNNCNFIRHDVPRWMWAKRMRATWLRGEGMLPF